MIWKTIGRSIAGTSHLATGKGCEDAVQYQVVATGNGDEVLVCCMADGAGSAQYAAWASGFVTREMAAGLASCITSGEPLTEASAFAMAEKLYEDLIKEAATNQVAPDEYACTLLGCCISTDAALFFQVGDGAIVRNDGSGYFIPVWWPHNGEYQNMTSFLIDDPALGNFKILLLQDRIDEVALFTDGLQMLALNMDGCKVHQPFFTGFFHHLRMAGDGDKIATLDKKLEEYLMSDIINGRTDDDKTLFLATRLPQ